MKTAQWKTQPSKQKGKSISSRRTDRPTDEEIAQAAYLRWLARGGEHGDHEKDWFEAEQELLGRKKKP